MSETPRGPNDHHDPHDHDHHDHHEHHHAEPHNHAVVGDLRIALGINVLFTVIELAGGLWTNSVAIIADAIHDLGDSVTLAVALALEKVSGRRRTGQLTFGYRRFSTLGALITGLILIIGAVTVLIHTVPRLLNPEPVDSTGMLLLAVLGVVMNTLAALRLSRNESMNARAAFLHLFEDVLGWVTVLIGAIAIRVWGIYLIDPLLSVGINIFVLTRAVPILLRALRVLLQYVPRGLSVEAVSTAVTGIEGVEDVHDIHLWTLDGSYTLVSAHVVTREDTTLADLQPLKMRIRDTLSALGLDHVTLEMEGPRSGCPACDL